MKKKLVTLILGGILSAAIPLWADTWTDPDTGYTWTYQRYVATAAIYNYGSAAISPSPSGAVAIPSTLGGKPVTSIGYSAFRDCGDLTSVTIPDSVTSIGDQAFYNCSGLTSVTIPNSVTSIGSSAFSGCNSSLYDTNSIPGVRLVDDWAIGTTGTLSGDLDLTGVRGIGPSAFSGCSGLTSVTIPDGVTSIGSDTFYNCSGLTSVTIPDGVTSIGQNSFYNCSGLTSVTIPDGVTSIGYGAFYYCSGLTSVTIGDGVTSIGSSAFSGCSGLLSITVGEGNPNYKSVNGLLLSKDGKTLVRGVNGNASIPDGVTSIGYEAFSDCSGLTSVTIPDSVTSIGEHAFYDCYGLTSVTIPNSVTTIGDWAFYGCSGLLSITVGEGNPNYKSENGLLLSKDGKCLIQGINGNVTIPDSVISIGYGAFSCCSGLTGVTIPDSVTSIGDYAFEGCSTLASVVIPDSVTTIGEGAFCGCGELASVRIGSGLRNISYGVFDGCDKLQYDETTIPGVMLLDGWAFGNDGSLSGDVALTGVRGIAPYAFDSCYELTSVIFPDSVSSIGEGAFCYCEALTNIVIPDSVNFIGEDAFAGCISITNVTMPVRLFSAPGVAISVNDWTISAEDDDMTEYQSASISRYESTSMSMTITGPCEFSFDWYVSSESGNDSLSWKLDGEKQAQIRGWEDYWSSEDCSIPSGEHTVEWIYSEDWSNSSGEDCGRVCLPSIFSSRSMSNIFPDSYMILESVALTGEAGTIPARAFEGCEELRHVKLPTGMTGLDAAVFDDCGNLQYDTTTIPGLRLLDGWVVGREDDLSGNLDLTGVKGFCDGVFEGCEGLTGVVLPNGLAGIGANLFADCSGLASVTIPDGVTRIGACAFSGCSSLESMTIPDSVTSIGNGAFAGCDNIQSVVIPQCVCSSRMSTIFPSSYRSITNVTISDSVTSIGEDLFYRCSGLTSVTIPDSVTSIGGHAFEDCSSLEELVVPSSVTYFGCHVFIGCDRLGRMVLPKWCKTVYVLYDEDGDSELSSEPFYGVINVGFLYYAFYDDDDEYEDPEMVHKEIEEMIASRIMIVYADVSGSTPISEIIKEETVNGYDWVYCIDGGTAKIEGVSPQPSGIVSIPATLGGITVTGISGTSFRGNNAIEGVVIPDGVVEIDDGAFSGCTRLASAWYRTIANASVAGSSGESSPSVVTTVVQQVVTTVITSVVQQVEAPYALTDRAADRAIASVTVNSDCAIDSFVLKDGKVYDSMLYVSNTADHEVTLSLPSGYTYKTIKGAKPLTIPAASQCLISITRVSGEVFLVMREELEDVK